MEDLKLCASVTCFSLNLELKNSEKPRSETRGGGLGKITFKHLACLSLHFHRQGFLHSLAICGTFY